MREFHEWVRHLFDRPVHDPAWHWDVDPSDHGVEAPETNAEYLRRLFTDAGRVLESYDDAQVKQGLNFIVHSACSDHAATFTQGPAPWPARRRTIEAIYDLYAGLFARRCERAQSQAAFTDAPATNPVNYVCFMFWDLLPAWADPEKPEDHSRTDAYLDVMRRCLTIDHPACVEGTLHGLSLWSMTVPDLTRPILDAYAPTAARLPPGLQRYFARVREDADPAPPPP